MRSLCVAFVLLAVPGCADELARERERTDPARCRLAFGADALTFGVPGPFEKDSGPPDHCYLDVGEGNGFAGGPLVRLSVGTKVRVLDDSDEEHPTGTEIESGVLESSRRKVRVKILEGPCADRNGLIQRRELRPVIFP